MITREQALKLLEEKVSNVNLRKHMWATEACRRSSAVEQRFRKAFTCKLFWGVGVKV